MPVTFTDGSGSTLEFLGGQLVLAADGTYTLEVEAEFNGGGVTMTDEGLYQLEGATLDFDPTGDPQRMVSGTVSGGSITAETQFGGIPFQVALDRPEPGRAFRPIRVPAPAEERSRGAIDPKANPDYILRPEGE